MPDRDPYVEAKRIDMTACLEKFYGRHAKWQQNAAWLQNGAKHEKHLGGTKSDAQPWPIASIATYLICKALTKHCE